MNTQATRARRLREGLHGRDTSDRHVNLQALLQERAAHIESMNKLVDAAEADGRRDLTAAELSEFDQREAAVRALDERIKRNPDSRDNPVIASLYGRQAPVEGLLRAEDSVAETIGCGPELRFDPLGTRDFDGFSFGRLVRAAVTGDRSGLSDAEVRALGEGSDATGGVVVPTQLSSNIIDRARAQSVAIQAGCLTAPMTEGNKLVLAKLEGGNTAVWHVENAPDLEETDQTWERIELTARSVIAGPQLLSRELYEDLSPEAEATIERELASAVALAFDLAVLEGTGTGQPLGIANTPGVNAVVMAANGAKPTSWAEVVKAWFAVKKNNGDDPTAAIFHPRDAENYALLTDTTGQPLRKPPTIENLPILTTTQIATDRDQGTLTGAASNGYVGDFSQVVIGVRPEFSIRLITLKERYATPAFQVGLLAYLRADVAVVRPEHLTKIVGLKA